VYSAEKHAVFYITVGCVLVYIALGGVLQVAHMTPNVIFRNMNIDIIYIFSALKFDAVCVLLS
jgi:hypothetical protein